jgi:polar amino acid transport system ATP-binding protein
MLNIVNVSKQFSQNHILKHVNVNIQKNSIIGLAGPSGSGKSTLLRCIQKLENIDAGSIEYSGTSSFMFQDFQLFPHMTVLENLTYAPKFTFGMKDHDDEALHLLEQLGLKNKAHSYPEKLSGGQKQRVALARCLMMKPKILLCDEPTSGLDVATIDDVVQLLKAVHSLGVTMVIASHDLDFLVRIAERIIVLQHGLSVADVEVSEIADPIAHLKVLYQESVI